MNQSLTADFNDAIQAVATSGLATWTCSIGAPLDPETAGQDALGQVNLTDYQPVAGLQNIQCMFSVLKVGAPDPGYEIRTPETIVQLAQFHVLLMGYYPQILQRQQATITSDADPTDVRKLDILTVESDSQRTMTRLGLRRYEV